MSKVWTDQKRELARTAVFRIYDTRPRPTMVELAINLQCEVMEAVSLLKASKRSCGERTHAKIEDFLSRNSGVTKKGGK